MIQKISNTTNINNVNFQGRLNVNISEKYLNELKNTVAFDTDTGWLIMGLKFLKDAVPKIGTEKDVIKLFSKENEKALFLQHNDFIPKEINISYPHVSQTLLEHICNIADMYSKNGSKSIRDLFDNHCYLHDTVENNIKEILTFNTKA